MIPGSDIKQFLLFKKAFVYPELTAVEQLSPVQAFFNEVGFSCLFTPQAIDNDEPAARFQEFLKSFQETVQFGVLKVADEEAD